MSNLYEERDIIEQGDHYTKHISAMTCEGLHSKSAIAAELAHRDIQLEQAQARVAELERDAARYQYIRANQYWTRSEGNDIDPGFSCVGTKFDYSDDFCARIMLDHHIDRRLRQQAKEAEQAGGEQ